MFAVYDAIKGLGSAAMYQFTDRIFEHFLSAIIVITATGRITMDEIIKIVTLFVLVYLAIELHKHIDGENKEKKQEEKKELADNESPSI